MVRKATVKDVKLIQRLLNEWSDKGKLLARGLGEIYDSVRDYYVNVNEDGTLRGVCALRVCW
ncbi:MAG: GNAT family N-acetyltransferase, partial [Pseudomonadota bacterium]